MATIKQEKAFNNLVENGGNVSKAMKDASYSENTYNTPQKLTTSKGFQKLLEEKVKDQHLVKSIKEGLKATKLYGKKGIEHPDYNARHKYLETGLRLKGLETTQAPTTLTNIAFFINQQDKPQHIDVEDITPDS